MESEQPSPAGDEFGDATEYIRGAIRALDLALETAEEDPERASLRKARLLLLGCLAAQEPRADPTRAVRGGELARS